MRRIGPLGGAFLLVLITACGLSIPADPGGTLDRVTGGHLRVGVSMSTPWTQAPDASSADQTPGGLEPELLDRFAASRHSTVMWELGGEEELVDALEQGRLDVVVGGLTAQTPWASRAAVTAPYVSVPGPDGTVEQHVMLTPMGENAFLVALERFLLDQDVTSADIVASPVGDSGRRR